METSLAEVEFLALSENRVEVLRLLAEGARDRSELAAETGASQATLGRILRDFEERSWVERRGGEYTATATGRLVSRGFTDLLDILATERELRGVVEYLPAEELTFDLRHLSDATVTVPSGTRVGPSGAAVTRRGATTVGRCPARTSSRDRTSAGSVPPTTSTWRVPDSSELDTSRDIAGESGGGVRHDIATDRRPATE